MIGPRLPTDGADPIRRGVVAAPRLRDGVLVELGLLPFRMIVPEHRLALDVHRLLRVGPVLEPVDVFEALAPIRDLLGDQPVQLAELSDLTGSDVRAALRVDLIAVLDRASHAALDGMPFPVIAPRAVLAEFLHWTVLHGSALLAPWLAEPVPPSVVRTCALAALAVAPGGGGALASIVEEYRDCFPELDSVYPDD